MKKPSWAYEKLCWGLAARSQLHEAYTWLLRRRVAGRPQACAPCGLLVLIGGHLGRVYRGPGRFGEAQPLLSELPSQTFACAKYSCVLVFDEAEPPHRKPLAVASRPRRAWDGAGAAPSKIDRGSAGSAPHDAAWQVVVFGGNLGSCYWERRFQKCHFWNPPGSGSAQEVQVGTGVLCIEKAAPKKLHISQDF